MAETRWWLLVWPAYSSLSVERCSLLQCGRMPRSLFALLWCYSLTAQSYIISTVAGGAPTATPTPAIGATIGSTARVVAGPHGSVYFTSLQCVFRVDRDGVLTRVAGNGRPGYSGDGGSATEAQLNDPNGLTFDGSGNLYIADTANSAIRKVSPDGTITTYVGPQTQLRQPRDVAADSAGNLYIADTVAARVLKVAPGRAVTTFAGTGTPGSSGDGGPATAAQLSSPSGLAADRGNLYVVDGYTRVRKIDSQGLIQTVAGTGTSGFSGDGGPATSAQLLNAVSVALDPASNLFISDSLRIRRVVADGVISTVAGSGSLEASGDGGPALLAGIARASGVAADGSGDILIAEKGRIRRFTVGSAISTVAGSGILSYSGDGGQATAAQIAGPAGLAVNREGNLFIADTGNNRIRKVTPDGVIGTIAGNGVFGGGGDGGPAIEASLAIEYPTGIAISPSGDLYFADSLNAVIRRISPAGVISKFAEAGSPGVGNEPTAVALDGAGNVFFTDPASARVRKVTPAGIDTVFVKGLNGPVGLAVDSSGNLFVSEYGRNRIIKVSPDGAITVYAGTGQPGKAGDGGPALSAQFEGPGPIAFDAVGNLWIGELSRLRMIDKGGTVRTVMLSSDEYFGDGGMAATAGVGAIGGIAADAAGNIYIADNQFHSIRKLRPGSVSDGPSILAVVNGASNRQGALAPGEVIVLYGTGLGPETLAAAQLDSSGRLSTQVAGISVLINGVPAPLVYTSSTQASAIVPYATADTARITVSYQGKTSAPVAFFVDSASPALFTADSSGRGQAAAVNQQGSFNSISTPAAPGSVIQLFATGEGATTHDGVDGKPAEEPLPRPVLPVAVTIGGKFARVLYAGGAPGATAGLMQINAEVPVTIPEGNAAVILQVGDRSSPDGVTVAVSK